MAKIAIIGAGSIVFCKTLVLDILATPGLQDNEFALMAPSRRRTPYVEAFVKRVIEANGNLRGYGGKVWRKRYLLELEAGLKPNIPENFLSALYQDQ